jgi:hypothetical protein
MLVVIFMGYPRVSAGFFRGVCEEANEPRMETLSQRSYHQARARQFCINYSRLLAPWVPSGRPGASPRRDASRDQRMYIPEARAFYESPWDDSNSGRGTLIPGDGDVERISRNDASRNMPFCRPRVPHHAPLAATQRLRVAATAWLP